MVPPSSVTNDRITKPTPYARRGMLFDTFFANPEFRDRFLLCLSETCEELRQSILHVHSQPADPNRSNA